MGLGQGQGSNHLAHCTHVAITPTSRIMVTGNRFSVLLASIIRLGKPGYVQKITMGLTQAHGYLSIISPIPTGFQSPHWRGLPRDMDACIRAYEGCNPRFQSPHWRGLPRDCRDLRVNFISVTSCFNPLIGGACRATRGRRGLGPPRPARFNPLIGGACRATRSPPHATGG